VIAARTSGAARVSGQSQTHHRRADVAKFTRILARLVYGLMAAAFLAAGAITLLVNTGLLPDGVRNVVVVQFGQNNNGFLHVIQELGSLLVLVGLVLVWCVRHYEQSRFIHWALTAYWALMALIHWFHVANPSPSLAGRLVNAIPFVLFLIIGILREATGGRGATPAPADREAEVVGVS
jgi:hypothetical protein